MLVRLDEFADILVRLQPGPCAEPTVTRHERVEVTTEHFARLLRGGGRGTNQNATRATSGTGRQTLRAWMDVPQVPSTKEHRRFSAVFA